MQRLFFERSLSSVRVRISWSFFLAFPLCWLVTGSLAGGIVAFICLSALALIHEFGHVAIARFCGIRVERIELDLLQGSCVYSGRIYPLQSILAAWGGPLAQLTVLVSWEVVYQTMHLVSPPATVALNPIFAVFIVWNAISLVVHLLPMEGMDGELAWRIVPALRNGSLAVYLRSRSQHGGLASRDRG
jgi:Zn-dependent protease